MQARAVHVGLIGPRGPDHLLELDSTHLLAFVEGLVCESEDGATYIQRMYDEARPSAPMSAEERAAQVARFAAMAGG